MKTKSFQTIFAGLFALVLCLSFASAVTISSSSFTDLSGWTTTGWTAVEGVAKSSTVDGASLSKSVSTAGYQTIILKYDRQLEDNWESDNNFQASWSVDGVTFTTLEEVLGSGVSGNTIPSEDGFISKQYSLPTSANNIANLQVKFECSTDAASESCNLDNFVVEGTAIVVIDPTPEATDYCEVSNIGEITLDIELENKGVLGDGEETAWYPTDTIEVTVDISNDGDEDVKKLQIGYYLLDSDGNEIIKEKKVKEIKLDSGDEDTVTFTFDINPKDLEGDFEDYTLYVVANGEMDSGDNDGDDTCSSETIEATMVSFTDNDDLIALDELKANPETVACGGDLIIDGKAWNIGADDQDNVYLRIYNTELKIDQKIELGDIDSLESEGFSYTAVIPQDIKEGTYEISIDVYNEDSDIYESDTSVLANYIILFEVEGNCKIAIPATVGATLENGGKAGQPMVIKASITNTGTQTATYTVNPTSYDSWASTATLVNPTIVEAGKTAEILITLNVNKGIEGTQTFNLEVISEDTVVANQPVEVEIQKSLFNLSGVMGDNWYLWLIGAVNILLIVIIIVVALRVSSE